MSLISFPYRWLPRTVYKNINHAWWDIKNGVRNIPIFFFGGLVVSVMGLDWASNFYRSLSKGNEKRR